MNTSWHAFLQDAGAVFSDHEVAHFGNSQQEIQVCESGSVICDLSHRGLIAISGNDAKAYLQGQLTNDIKLVTHNRSQLSGYCSPKGRLLAIIHIVLIGETYYCELPAEILDDTLARLRKYILMAKVTLEDARDRFVRIGFSGPGATSALKSELGGAPVDPGAVAQTREFTIVRLNGLHPRFVVYGTEDAVRRLWSALDVHAAPVGKAAWERLDILAGIPTVVPATVDRFVPQFVNLEVLDGVSLKKGCYTGQEIVARLQYRGTVKRRMHRFHIDADPPPAAGDPLYGASDGGQSVGDVVSAAPSTDGGHDVLAVVTVEAFERGGLHLRAADGPAVEHRPLPYALPTQ